MIGLVLLDFPGKRRLEQRILARRRLRAAINRLRARFGREPLVLDDHGVSGPSDHERSVDHVAMGVRRTPPYRHLVWHTKLTAAEPEEEAEHLRVVRVGLADREGEVEGQGSRAQGRDSDAEPESGATRKLSQLMRTSCSTVP